MATSDGGHLPRLPEVVEHTAGDTDITEDGHPHPKLLANRDRHIICNC